MPKPTPVERDEELEAFIHDLIERLGDMPEGSAEQRMIVRQLQGIKATSEFGSLVIEDYETSAKLFIPGRSRTDQPDRPSRPVHPIRK